LRPRRSLGHLARVEDDARLLCREEARGGHHSYEFAEAERRGLDLLGRLLGRLMPQHPRGRRWVRLLLRALGRRPHSPAATAALVMLAGIARRLKLLLFCQRVYHRELGKDYL